MRRLGKVSKPVSVELRREDLKNILLIRQQQIRDELRNIREHRSWPGDRNDYREQLRDINRQLRQVEGRNLPRA